jgi:cystathionine beta-synthase
MDYAESILDLIGNTPLVRLTHVTRDLGPIDRQPLILAKLEAMNPGGSVKDRIGLPMIEAAERAGLLKPGGTIVEPTSGNTGHGLAIAAALKGYRCIFVMADKQSPEKQALLRAYGAEVVLCPTNVEPESPESYYSVAARLARDIPGAFKPDQYWNAENPAAHEKTTGPEIWAQTEGRITHLVASVGTGGTVSGIGHFLKSKNPGIRIIGADPEGSVLSGDTARPYLTEGVGEDFMPGTHDPKIVDRWVRVSDRVAFQMARRITREEGILSGESCGTAVVAALDEARRLMAEDPAAARAAVMVVILPDGGRNYLSKLYNDEWMRANGLLATAGAVARVADLLAARDAAAGRPEVIIARTTDRVGAAIDVFQQFGISQMPVSQDASGDVLSGIVGSIGERGLLDRVYRNPEVVDRTVGEVMDRSLPTIAIEAPVDDAFRLLAGDANAVLAVRDGRPAGVVTKLDVLEYLAHAEAR